MIKKLLDTLVYTHKRNSWMFDDSRDQLRDPRDIDHPIFLLGVQGGGLTFVSRVLRRHPQIVSVTGDHTYWWGADEMQNVLRQVLPVELAGIKSPYPDEGDVPKDKQFTTPRGWLYAVNELLPYYRMSSSDATPLIATRLQQLIAWLLERHGSRIDFPRFTDKSQVLTVKMPFVQALLTHENPYAIPYFVLVTRNPYALCYRSVVKQGEAPELKEVAQKKGHAQALKYAAQHWANSMRVALEDSKKIERFTVVQFEEFLQHPERELKKLCSFVDLTYHESMLPHATDKIGLGSRPGHSEKWYPIRPDVNDKYLNEMSKNDVEIITAEAGTIAEKLGYNRPKK